jgi:hypothetical protein
MLGKRKNHSRTAGGWLRDTAVPMSKTKRMADGEVTALLIGQGAPPEDLETEAFESLIRLRETLGKATGATVVAYAIGLLTLSNMLTGLSASGMEIERGAFGHVSLLLVGLTNFWWATTFAKASYIGTWFAWRLESAEPPDKAVMLLRFPEAFPYFAFFPGTRGYPKHVWPARSEIYQVISLVLIVAAVLIFAAGAMALNVALAIEVWRSGYPTPSAAKWVVAGSVVLSLLGLAVPRFNTFKVGYQHYGLTNLLSAMTPERREKAHRRLAAATARRPAADGDV